MRTIGLICAKGESVRCPGKHMADINGRPLFTYAIDVAVASDVCDEILVSTDSEDIANAALERGQASVFLRTEEYAALELRDTARKTLEDWEHQMGERYDICVLFHGTAIFVRPSWVREAVRLVKEKRFKGTSIGNVSGAYCCSVHNLAKYGGILPHYSQLPHDGINIDIDMPQELELAVGIMTQIQEGRISYPLEEEVHTNKGV